MASVNASNTILLVGASRGLGYAMVEEFLKRSWSVVGTVRKDDVQSDLHALLPNHRDSLEIEIVDTTRQDEVAALRERLSGREFGILFVNAGTANKNQEETIAEVSTEEFIHVMLTNALAPMRFVEAFQDLVHPDGLIGVMSSGQGSIGQNTNGGHEVYRGTKAALNQYMRSYAARHDGDGRPLALIAPGWVRTALGGPEAPFTIEDSIPSVVDTLLAKRSRPGLEFLDRKGKVVPW